MERVLFILEVRNEKGIAFLKFLEEIRAWLMLNDYLLDRLIGCFI